MIVTPPGGKRENHILRRDRLTYTHLDLSATRGIRGNTSHQSVKALLGEIVYLLCRMGFAAREPRLDEKADPPHPMKAPGGGATCARTSPNGAPRTLTTGEGQVCSFAVRADPRGCSSDGDPCKLDPTRAVEFEYGCAGRSHPRGGFPIRSQARIDPRGGFPIWFQARIDPRGGPSIGLRTSRATAPAHFNSISGSDRPARGRRPSIRQPGCPSGSACATSASPSSAVASSSPLASLRFFPTFGRPTL